MPYGLYVTNDKTLVTSLPGLSRFTFDEVLSIYEPTQTVIYDSPLSKVIRAGGNTSRFFDTQHPDSYTISFKKYRKKMGTRVVFRKQKHYEKSDVDGASRLVTTRVKVEVPVFVDAYKAIKTRVKRPGLNNSLFAPNPLVFESTKKWCSLPSNTFTRTFYFDSGRSTFIREAIKVSGWPKNLYWQGGWTNWFPQVGEDDLLRFRNKTLAYPPGIQELDNEALRKLYAKVSSEFPSYLVDIAQSNKTIATVKKIGKTALKVIKSIKKLDVAAAKGVIKGLTPQQLTDLWLEYIYGVAPTLQTINDSIDLFNRGARDWRSYSTSSSVKEIEKTSGIFPDNLAARPFMKFTGTHSTHLAVRYGCIMTGNQAFSRYVNKEFSVSGAAGLAYELIPFSFMLDWVYDLGSFINSHTIFDTNLLYAWKTYFIKESCEYTYSANNDVWTETIFKPFNLSGEYVRCNRTVLNPIDFPDMPPPKLKTLDKGLSLQRSVNALAIAISVVR